MTVYNNGTVMTRGLAGRMDKLLDALVQHGLDDNEIRVVEDGDEAIIFIEEYMGNVDDDFRKAVEDLYKEGIGLEGEYKYYGDYDGFALVKDGKLTTYDLEWYTLIAGDDSCIVDELRNRGYDVSSLEPQLEERKKEGKDKVVSL